MSGGIEQAQEMRLASDPLAFFVPGRAAPGGSKRAFQVGGRIQVADANPRVKPWQGVVAAAAAEYMHGGALLDGPLQADLEFVVARPKGHYGAGRNHGVVRASAPRYPIGRPDVLKLGRAVEDALTGVLWRDDAQVVIEHLTKRYGYPIGVYVTVRRLDAQDRLASL